jgi:hypothetical protein
MTYYKLEDALQALRSKGQLLARCEKLVAGKSKTNYVIFNDPSEYVRAINQSGGTSTYHEITKTAYDPYPSYQKLYFDIDAAKNLWGDLSPKDYELAVLEKLLAALATESEIVGEDFDCTPLVMTSSDYVEKVSLHVIFPNILFSEHSALRRAAMRIISHIVPFYAKSFDLLYRKNGGLRMIYSVKLKTTRTKLPLLLSGYEDEQWSDDRVANVIASTIHTYSDDTYVDEHGNVEKLEPYDDCFPEDVTVPNSCNGTMSEKMKTIALKALYSAECIAALNNHGTSPPIGGAYEIRSIDEYKKDSFLISVNRKHISACIVCNRDHEHEHGYITVHNGNYKYKCHRAHGTGSHSIVIYQTKHKTNGKSGNITLPDMKLISMNMMSSVHDRPPMNNTSQNDSRGDDLPVDRNARLCLQIDAIMSIPHESKNTSSGQMFCEEEIATTNNTDTCTTDAAPTKSQLKFLRRCGNSLHTDASGSESNIFGDIDVSMPVAREQWLFQP